MIQYPSLSLSLIFSRLPGGNYIHLVQRPPAISDVPGAQRVKQIKSICALHTTECNVTLYVFVCLWRESTVRKGSVEQTLAAWHLWTECSGQWHGLGGPNRTVLPTTNSPVQESVSNIGVLKLLSLLYCLFCIFDSLKTLTVCVNVCIWGVFIRARKSKYHHVYISTVCCSYLKETG